MSTTTKTMTVQEVANRLVSLCREGKFEDAIKELYAPNIISIEPKGAQSPERTEGFDKVLAKTKHFGESLEQVHSMSTSDPIIADNFVSVGFSMDITVKGAGRMKMNELAVYQVATGKIVWEQFFYTPMPSQN